MTLPKPEVGLIIGFNYLSRREHDQGRDNALYPRPCAIILSRRRAGVRLTIVMVSPITHSAPTADEQALDIPLRAEHHLGLNDARSWVVTHEANEFV
ncbi:hypothetical protein [Phenylobacterium sp.]|uniref:hypothetical protein n=1 Tax=Phenylobacterium sp. TaxID=1871053 RepID=UPI003BAB661F